MSRWNIEIFASVSPEHVTLNFPETIEDLNAIDHDRENRTEEKIVDEIRSPIDFHVEEMKDRQMKTI